MNSNEAEELNQENPLTKALPPTPAQEATLRMLLYKPPIPGNIGCMPVHLRMQHLTEVLDLHIPSLSERQLAVSVNMMVRTGYRYRDPRRAPTWAAISGESIALGMCLPKSMAAAVEGLSGVGKTEACLRSLHCLGPQVIRHKAFPQVVDGLTQTVWLSVEAPPSGRAADLARSLMAAWDDATGGQRFAALLRRDRFDGMRALDEWRTVARAGFLGVLHVDEIQNLFKIRSLRDRSRALQNRQELSIVEDGVLRWFLSLINTGQIPVLVSGTPDGIGALSKRLSTAERFNTAGYHRFDRFDDPMAAGFRKSFLETLGHYQYVSRPIPVDDELAALIIKLTAGIPRIIIALWMGAHRVAFGREEDDLRISDFVHAAATWLAPLAPAIEAIRTGNAKNMSRYEDLVPADNSFWASFWSNMSNTSTR
jgi:hypothetical protein